MKMNLKKLLALLLSVALVLGVVPASVFAAGDGAAQADLPKQFVNGYIPFELHGSKAITNAYTRGDMAAYSELTGKTRATLPSSYDSRNYGCVTSVKNQNPYGTCWAFGTMAAIESSMIKNGKIDANTGNPATTSTDLSEYHLAWYTFTNAYDKDGMLTGDKSSSSSGYLDQGGNGAIATLTLMRWEGVASEATSALKYSNASSSGLGANYAYQYNMAHIKNSYWINVANTDAIKEAIMEYGAGTISYYADQTSTYFNSSTGAYYYNGSSNPNHAVTVVGWDDNYAVSNFNSSRRPSQPGAWIIKNSWGSSWGKSGYFYLSYEDKSVAASGEIFFYDVDAVDNYNHNYQYDGTLEVSKYQGLDNQGKIANVFTATGSQSLKAVAVNMWDEAVTYTVDIYKNPTNAKNPTSGTLETSKSGYFEHPGYFTVELDNPVSLAEGDKFAVVFTLSCPEVDPDDNKYVHPPYDSTGSVSGFYTTTHVNHGDSSFYKNPSGSWTDCPDNGDFRIKAYTDDVLYTVTAVSNNTAWGTVSVNGTKIICTPAAGYYVSGYEVTSGTATAVINVNTINVAPESNCTIRVIFAPKPTYTVNFVSSGAAQGSQTAQVYDVITLPATASVTAPGWTFAGWMTQQIDETTDKPEYFAPGASYTVTGNVTLYAVYTRVESSTEKIYEIVTGDPDDWTGNYVITYGKDSSLLAFKGVQADQRLENSTSGSATAFASTGMTLEGTTLKNVPAAYVFSVAPNGSYFTIKTTYGTWIGTQSTYLHNMASYQEGYSDWNIEYDEYEICMKVSNVGSTQYTYLVKSSNYNYFVVNTTFNTNKTQFWKETTASTTYYWTDPVAAEHTHNMQAVAAAAPTCTENGNTAYYRCTICGKCFSDANGENEITEASTVIAALGHNYVDTVTPPTETQQGYTTHTCSRCGDSYVDTYVPALGSDFTVHFSVPAGVTKPADMVSNTNTGITLPTVEGPEGYTFLGWVTEDYDNVETCPASILTGNYIAPQEITLKALYTYVEGNSGSETVYELVSTAPSDLAGDYVITFGTNETSNEQGFFLMKGVEAATSNYGIESPANRVAYADTGATLEGTTLKNVADDYIFNVAFLGTYYTIQSKTTGIYLGMNTSSYLSGYGTYNSTYCRWTIPAVAENFCSAKNARSGASYPYISFGYESSQYSEPYFWAGSSSSIGSTGLALSVRWWKATEIEAGTSYYTTIIGEEHVHTPAAPVIENEVPATCTTAGSYDSVVYCSECGEEISRETVTVPALGHTAGAAVKENEVAATCTAAGSYDMVVYCTVCGAELSRETTTVPALGHNWSAWTSNNNGTHTRTCAACGETETHDCEFGNDTVCDVCGYEKKLNFSASLSLDNATGFNYKVAVAEVDALGLDSFHLVVVHTAYDKATNTYNDETVILEGSKSGSYYSFDFADIPAMALNDKMVAHLEGTKNGETWSSNAIDFNAIDYCYLVTTLTSQPESLRRTCANLILFAESAQINFSYNTANLPTAKWSDVQENLCDRDVPTWTTDYSSEPLEGAAVTFGGLMLDVNSRIDLRFVIDPGNLNAEDLTAEIHYEGLKGASKSFTIPGSEWTDYGTQGRKAVTLHEMNAGELQSSVAIVIKDANGNAVSSTLHYSVDNYAGILYNLSSTSSEMKNMMVTMINYSLRAKVYLESK